ncbi:MAG: hypothetical protein J3T61_06870 [Candidatus Brocadiales bacterium]|nr:hypothetical protein [Candidatus Bathyanammoxibius sp.]
MIVHWQTNGHSGVSLVICPESNPGGELVDPVARNFVAASVIYLFIGTCLGLLMAFFGLEDDVHLRFAHSHLNLLGWVSMMIYGVGYHILPRFSGNPVAYPQFMAYHFWLANIGLLGLVGLWGYSQLLTGVFALLSVLGTGLFVVNILASIRPAPETD